MGRGTCVKLVPYTSKSRKHSPFKHFSLHPTETYFSHIYSVIASPIRHNTQFHPILSQCHTAEDTIQLKCWKWKPAHKNQRNRLTNKAAVLRCQSGYWSRPRDLNKPPKDRRKDTTTSGGDSRARGEVLPPSDWAPARQYRAGAAAPHWSPPDSRLLPGRKTPWRERHTTLTPQASQGVSQVRQECLGQILSSPRLSCCAHSIMHILMCTAIQKLFLFFFFFFAKVHVCIELYYKQFN